MLMKPSTQAMFTLTMTHLMGNFEFLFYLNPQVEMEYHLNQCITFS